MSTLQLPEAVKEAAASTRLVYAVLDDQGPLPLEEIIRRTGVARRTARRALGTLRERGLASAEPHPDDSRRCLYHAGDKPGLRRGQALPDLPDIGSLRRQRAETGGRTPGITDE